MTEFTLNIKLTASDELLEALRFFTSNAKQPATESAIKKTIKEKAVEASQETKEEKLAEKLTEKTITREDIRAAVQEKSGKKHEIKNLLKEFDADNVTSLKEEYFSDFVEKLKAL